MRFLLACTSALTIALSSPAAAAWNVAQSRHFVIYANENATVLKDFATKLERFDQAARVAISMADPDQGRGNRLTVFVLSTPADVRSIIGDRSGWLAGFYSGRVSGSLAYVPRTVENPNFHPEALFFHEYTHHLMMQALDRPYPEWYVEGFAEFLSTAQVERDGSVRFGAPLQERAYALLNEMPMSVEMLIGGLKPDFSNQQKNQFYAWGWLLADYLQMSPKREGQLNRYLDLLAAGRPGLAAAEQAFGDLKRLDKELDVYRMQRFTEIEIPASKIHLGNIDVQPLSPGAAQVIALRARIKYAPQSPNAEELAAKVRAVESRYPGDNLVENTLAEAELDAGHAAAAQAAAERALKANPADTEAMVFEGRAIEEQAPAGRSDARHATFERARQEFVAANKLDTEDPKPLIEFFRSFLKEGVRPTDNAIAALHYASDLAPQDLGVRMTSAIAYLRQGKSKEARTALTVVAYAPHENQMADTAKRMIGDIDGDNPVAALAEIRRSPPRTAPGD